MATHQPNEALAAIGDLDECDRVLEFLETNPSEAEQTAALGRLVARHSTINVEIGRGMVFWRASKCSPAGFDCESRVGYPPAHMAEARRFNDRGEPVLYLATRRETAFAEIGAQEGDYIQLTGFQAKPHEYLRLASVGEWLNVHKQGRMRVGDSRTSNAVTQAMNREGTEMGRLLIYVDAVLGDLLARPDAAAKEYLTTRLIIRQLYQKLPKIDGLFYPSVKDILGLNLAVRSTSADRALETCSSIVARINKVRRFGVYEFETVRAVSGVTAEGTFQWLETAGRNEFILYRVLPEEVERGDFAFAENSAGPI